MEPIHHEPFHHEPPPVHHEEPVHHFGNSGHKFLTGVSALFNGAEASALVRPRSTILSDIQHKVRSELGIGPEGNHYTDIIVGHTTPGPPPRGRPPTRRPGHFNRRKGTAGPQVDVNPRSTPRRKRKRPAATNDGYATGTNGQKSQQKNVVKKKLHSPSKPSVSSAAEPESLSFSELMSDFFQDKPLPYNAAQKTRNLDTVSPPYG
jgi:hypothetical protein